MEIDFRKRLDAAELLLSDVKSERAALDRREAELRKIVAMYRGLLGTDSAPKSEIRPFSADETLKEDENSSYGAISSAVLTLLQASPRKMSAQQIADALEREGVPIRAKTYYAAVRSAIRNLYKSGRIRRVGQGFYRPI